MFTRAVFLDKDGTLIENVPYNVDVSQIRLVDGALDGLRKLHAAGYQIVVISNQSGVAYGKFKEEALKPVEDHLRKLMESAGVPLSGFYYCPHHPDGRVSKYAVSCFCRKPSPGMLFQAARELEINLAASWMVGDILNDIEAGRRADCRTVLIDNGNETEWKLSPLREPHFAVKSFVEAADAILCCEAPLAELKKEKLPVKVLKTTTPYPIARVPASVIAVAAARAAARVSAQARLKSKRAKSKAKF